jgi:hypothetical protein
MRRALTVLLAALATAGCGAQQSEPAELSGDEQQVADVLADLQTAAEEDAPRRVCTDLLARDVARRLGAGCTRAVEQAFAGSDTFTVSVEDVRIAGPRARARISTGVEDEEELVELVREGDVWRIARFAGPVS